MSNVEEMSLCTLQAIRVALILFGVSALLGVIILIPRKWGFSHDLQESLNLIKARQPIRVTWRESPRDCDGYDCLAAAMRSAIR